MERNNPFRSAAINYISKHQDLFGSGEIQIVIPDESVLPYLYETFGVMSFEEMFPNKNRDLDRILSKMIFSWRNYQDIKNGEIDGIRVLDEESITSIYGTFMTIYYIEGMLQDEESANYLEGVILSEVKGAKSNFTNLPSNVLQLMIETGQIIGKDLTSICSTNQKMKIFCSKNNYEIFRLRLLKEYGVRYDESWYKNKYDPIELYKKYHTHFLRVVEYDKDQFGAQYFIDNDPVSSFDDKVFSEVTYAPGLFDYFPKTIIPLQVDYGGKPYFLIFDRKAPEESASLYAFEGFLRTFITYGENTAPILIYLKAAKRQGQFKEALKRNIDETHQNFGHFKFENTELTFVKFTM